MKKKALFIEAKSDYAYMENRYPHLGFGYLASLLRRDYAYLFDISIAKTHSMWKVFQ